MAVCQAFQIGYLDTRCVWDKWNSTGNSWCVSSDYFLRLESLDLFVSWGPFPDAKRFLKGAPKSWSTWPSNFWLIYFSQDSLCVLGSYLFIYFLQSLRSNTQYKASSSYRLDRLWCVTTRPVSFFRCVVFHYSSGFQRFFWGRKWWKQLSDQSGVV